MVKSRLKKVAVGCQGGGMHAAFEVGVLSEILRDCEKKRFELVGVSGTSAGALCALMVWYGLAPKNGKLGCEREAIDKLNNFWDHFVAETGGEKLLNMLTFGAFRVEEAELPGLGIGAPILSFNPRGAIYRSFAAFLPQLGVRQQYFDLEDMLAKDCPEFDRIDWPQVTKRVLIGASEVVKGFETVFDSDVNRGVQPINKGMRSTKEDKQKTKERKQPKKPDYWRQQLPLSLNGIAASGTLPIFREAERIDGGFYWDGLYSQNPPVREFLAGVDKNEVPDELWIVRINPQQWPEEPKSNGDVLDRQNELMGNLSLHKELGFILTINDWAQHYGGKLQEDIKKVTVRTIKMRQPTADNLRYSSKFNRSHEFMDQLRKEGHEVARDWLDRWPDNVGLYPEDAAYP